MERRKFIELTGLALSSFGIGAEASLAGELDRFSDKDPVKIGIIGTGSRGNKLIRLMKGLPQFEVVACCDVLPYRLERGLSTAGKGVKGYTDYRKLLDHKKLEAVLIATPLFEHFPMAMDAIDQGLHVYCEKTMVFTIEQALAITRKVRSGNRVFQVGYQHRYNPLYNNINRTIQGGHLGTITHAEAHWNRNGSWRRKVEDPKDEKLINWRMYWDSSGGLMSELCSHQIDILDYLLDGHMQKVTGFGGIDYWKDGRETFDNLYATFEYPKGIKASFHALTTNSFEGFSIKIYGTRGTVVIKGEGVTKGYIYPERKVIEELKTEVDGISGATIKNLERGEPIPILVDKDFPENDDGPSSAALSHFAKCIREGSDPIADVNYGRKSAISVALANKALREGTVEHWDNSYSI